MRGVRGSVSPVLSCVLVPLVGTLVGADEVTAGEVFESWTEVDGGAEPVAEALFGVDDALDLSEGAGVDEGCEESDDCEGS